MSWFDNVVSVFKGRRKDVHHPGESPPSEAMDPALADLRTRPPQDKPAGGAGIGIYGGYPNEVERHPDLIGPNKFRTYNNNVRNVDSLAVGVRALLMLIRGVHWDADPPQSGKTKPNVMRSPEEEPTLPGTRGRKPKPTEPGMPAGPKPAPPKPKAPAPTEKLASPPARPKGNVAGDPVDDEATDPSTDVDEPAEGVEPEVDPVAEEALRLAQWLENVLFDEMNTPWTSLIGRMGMYKFHGFSLHEWTGIRREDGTIGIASVQNRPQVTIEKWDLDRSGELQGVIQRIPLDGKEEYLPRWKTVYVVDDELADGDPQGVGLFRHSAQKVVQLQRLEQLEIIGFETDLRGIPVTRAPLEEIRDALKNETLTAEEATAMLAPLDQFMRGHTKNKALAVRLDSAVHRGLDANGAPSSVPKWDVSLLTGDSQGHEAIRIAVEGKQREIARVAFAEGFLLGGDGGSNRALGEEKSRFLSDFANSTLTDIANALNMDLVRPLWELNGYPKELRPTLRFEAVSVEDVVRVAEMLDKMGKAGAKLHPKDPVINTVRVRARLPKVPDELVQEMADQATATHEAELEATRTGAAAAEAGAFATTEGVRQKDDEMAQSAENAEADREAKLEQARLKPKPAPTKPRPRK